MTHIFSVHSKAFEHAVEVAIAANAVLVATGVVVHGHESLFEQLHKPVLAFFVVELLVKLWAGGWGFIRRPLNAFDAAVISLSLMPALGAGASLLRVARLARLAHLTRLPHLISKNRRSKPQGASLLRWGPIRLCRQVIHSRSHSQTPSQRSHKTL
jgi:hypothetical protein